MQIIGPPDGQHHPPLFRCIWQILLTPSAFTLKEGTNKIIESIGSKKIRIEPDELQREKNILCLKIIFAYNLKLAFHAI